MLIDTFVLINLCSVLMDMLHGSEREECRGALVSGLRKKLLIFKATALKTKEGEMG